MTGQCICRSRGCADICSVKMLLCNFLRHMPSLPCALVVSHPWHWLTAETGVIHKDDHCSPANVITLNVDMGLFSQRLRASGAIARLRRKNCLYLCPARGFANLDAHDCHYLFPWPGRLSMGIGSLLWLVFFCLLLVTWNSILVSFESSDLAGLDRTLCVAGAPSTRRIVVVLLDKHSSQLHSIKGMSTARQKMKKIIKAIDAGT